MTRRSFQTTCTLCYTDESGRLVTILGRVLSEHSGVYRVACDRLINSGSILQFEGGPVDLSSMPLAHPGDLTPTTTSDPEDCIK